MKFKFLKKYYLKLYISNSYEYHVLQNVSNNKNTFTNK